MATFNVAGALKAGYSQDQINGYIQQNKLTPINVPTTTPTQTPVAPTVTPQVTTTPAQTSSPDIATNLGQGALNFLSSLVKPFVDTAKTIGGAGFENMRIPILNSATNTLNKNTQAQLDVIQKLKQETDPAKKIQLLKQAQDLSNQGDQAKQVVQQASVQDPFLNNQELQRASNPQTAAIDTAKRTAGIASYAVPFGEGANLLTKVLLPGAAVGGLQGAAEENATPASVTGNALLGAGGAGVLGGLLGIPGLFNKAGQGIEKAGNALVQDVNKIQLEPSVYGAAKEKAVQQTVNNIPGLTAAQKYENLQPVMQSLGNRIQDELQSNPKAVPISDVKAAFMKNLSGVLRTKDINSSQAQNEINGYLGDLYKELSTTPAENVSGLPLEANTSTSTTAKGVIPGQTKYVLNDKTGNLNKVVTKANGKAPEYAVENPKTPYNPSATGNILPENISTEDLFNLKKQVNQDYQAVQAKIDANQPLNARQKVIAAARQTLDNIITEQHPDIKQATLLQSHLYDAAEPLAKARNADHSIPIFSKGGIGIPSGVVQGVKTVVGNTARATGKSLQSGQSISNLSSNPAILKILGLAGANLAVNGPKQSVGNSNGNQSQPENPITQQTNNESNGQNNQQINQSTNNIHTNSIPQDVNNVNNYGANTSSGIKITPQQVTAAQLMLPPMIADRIKAAYQAQFGGLQPADIQQQQGLLKETQRISSMIDQLQPDQGKVAASNLLGVFGKGDTGIQQLQAEAASLNQDLVTTLHRRGMSPEQMKSMDALLIQPGKDSVQQMKSKIAGINNLLQNFYPYSTGDATGAVDIGGGQ